MFKRVIKGWRYWLGAAGLLAGVLLLFPDLASAGGDTTTMNEVYGTLTGWCQGAMGKVISLGMILVGIIGGIARQSLMSFAVGIGGGLGLQNANYIIDAVVTATLTNDVITPNLLGLMQ